MQPTRGARSWDMADKDAEVLQQLFDLGLFVPAPIHHREEAIMLLDDLRQRMDAKRWGDMTVSMLHTDECQHRKCKRIARMVLRSF